MKLFKLNPDISYDVTCWVNSFPNSHPYILSSSHNPLSIDLMLSHCHLQMKTDNISLLISILKHLIVFKTCMYWSDYSCENNEDIAVFFHAASVAIFKPSITSVCQIESRPSATHILLKKLHQAWLCSLSFTVSDFEHIKSILHFYYL